MIIFDRFFLNLRAYFTFFTVVTVVASLNDYWRMLRLDVLFADPTTEVATGITSETGEDSGKHVESTPETAGDPVEMDPGII